MICYDTAHPWLCPKSKANTGAAAPARNTNVFEVRDTLKECLEYLLCVTPGCLGYDPIIVEDNSKGDPEKQWSDTHTKAKYAQLIKAAYYGIRHKLDNGVLSADLKDEAENNDPK